MKRKRLVTTIGVFFLIIGVLGLITTFNSKEVSAQIKCPQHMDPNSLDCYYYIKNELTKINQQKNHVQKELKGIEYQKLSIEEKIQYTNNLIAQTENEIKKLQLEISATDIEIKMLEKEIKQREDDISMLKTEVGILSSTVNDRITEIYKYSFINQFEFLLDFKNISEILRRVKYLKMTRTQDRAILGKYTAKTITLIQEEDILNIKKGEFEEKREKVDKEKIELGEQKLSLDAQRKERETLLSHVKTREVRLAAELKILKDRESEATNFLSALAMQNFNSGTIPANTPVKAGVSVLGYQGHTGYSFGSHLHFELWRGGKRVDPIGLGYFRGGTIYGKLYNGSAKVPLGEGAILTQNYNGNHHAIDMVGGFSGGEYTLQKAIVCYNFPPIPAGYKGKLNGEGTPIKPIKDGKVTSVQTDKCGGKYVIVDHGDGETSLYLHLR